MARRPARRRRQQGGQADSGHKKQWIAGGLAIAFGYAALMTTGLGVYADPIQTFVNEASIAQIPLHVTFSLAMGTIGAGAAAVWDKVWGGSTPQRARRTPTPGN